MANVAIVGCGAVTELMYVPAINRLKLKSQDIKVTAVVDKNIESAKKIASAFGDGTGCLSDYRELFSTKTESVIITLPNYLHASVATEFLQRGINVFLEKPMGISIKECDSLIKSSKESGALLTINHFRRRYPSLQVVKNLIKSNLLGKMTAFNVYEGRKYDWPLASHWLFDSAINKGGTLIHNGCHTVDILIWMLEEMDVLEYRDDRINGKGIEADCDITVKTKDGATGKIRMSFVTRLKNKHSYEFEKGWITWNSDNVTGFEFGFRDIPSVQKVSLSRSGSAAHSRLFETPVDNFSLMECFADQIENFLESINRREALYVTGADAKRSIEFIERCYSNRKPIVKTWQLPADLKAAGCDKKETIAVLGASGFIGLALVQRMAESRCSDIRPAVRSYSKGAAICQTGYPLHLADVKDKQSLIDLFKDCSTVYHCAVGDDETIVSGITNCIEAAVAAGVKKLIYMSTARVFGYDYSNVTDTSMPKPPQWNSYAVWKANAEKTIEEARSKYALDIRILRPCVVWGPGSALWTTNIMSKILNGEMVLLDEPQNVCNLIYIDNLIDILLMVKNHPDARNANFNVSDFHMPWKDFVASYCDILSVPFEGIPSVSWETANRSLKKDYMQIAKGAFNETLKVPEVKDLILSIPGAKKYALKRRERLNNKFQEAGNGGNTEKERPAIDKAFLNLQNCRSVLNCENLRSLLKYQPRVDFQSAVNQTRDWLTFNGFIG